MNGRAKKFLLLLLAAALLFGSGRMQKSLNHDRDTLGLTRTAVLQNAPPVLAFTTVALGGFRGLISNFLWMRANELQQDDKFFEAAQLADWITKLEPTFTQVWLFQAWNMAYNISVKFKENKPGDYSDRWHWVERGIDLLRDDGLRYNPNSILIYRELGWFFQHKMGQNLDDGNIYFKMQWKNEMQPFFGPYGTNFDGLLHPQTAEDFQRLQVFTNRYKLDPGFAKAVDGQYGPLDWRLPEAHAIYWASKGLTEATNQPDKVTATDVITVRRIIYQSLLQSFQHGRILTSPYSKNESLGPNLDLVQRVNSAYLQAYAEERDASMTNNIINAHRNFLRNAVYFLYEADRMNEAQKWFNYLGERYPNKGIVDNRPDSFPRNLTLDEYAVAVVQADIGETSQDRITSAVAGLLTRAYYALALGEEDRYANFKRLAGLVHERYTAKTAQNRVPLLPFNQMNNGVVKYLVSPESGMSYGARAALATRLALPPEWLNPPSGTNSAPAAAGPISTNTPATNATNAAAPAQP